MRVLLIDPPMQSIMLARADWFPMGLCYLAGSLKQAGHDCLVYNAEHNSDLDYQNLKTYSDNYHLYLEALDNSSHNIWKTVASIISDFNPDVVGITAFSVKFESAKCIAKLAKDFDNTMPVIMGGQHATIMTNDVLDSPYIDFVVRGEGEKTIVEFIDQLEGDQNWGTVDGLSYKHNGQIIHNQNRELNKDIDSLPFPDRTALYDIENYEPDTLAKLFTSRGCPYKCTYCGTQNIWTNRVRFHSSERIVEEIKMVKQQFGATFFTFFDDVFALNKNRTLELTKKMVDADLNIRFDCLTRVNLLSDNLLINMKKAGCVKIDIGVESGSQRILEDTIKDLTIEQIIDGAQLIKKHGIFLASFLMIGLPTENEEDINLTKKFLLELQPNWAHMSIFTPIPGTKIFNDLVEQGHIPEKTRYAEFSHQSPNTNFAVNMKNRDNFPELAQNMLEFVQNYNGSYKNLLRRALTRGYHRNIKLLLWDIKKFASWKYGLRRE